MAQNWAYTGASLSGAPTAEELLRSPDALINEAEDMIGYLESKTPLLDVVRREYEILYEGLQKSIEAGANTERKVEEIIAEITFTREQVMMIRRGTDENRASQERLSTAISTMRAKADAMEEDDRQIKKTLESLSNQVTEFREALARGPGWTEEQLKERAKLQQQEDNLSRNANSRNQALMFLRQEVAHLTAEVSELEAKKSGGEEENERLTRAIADKEAEAIAVNQKKTDSEHQLLDLQVELGLHKETLKTMVTQASFHRTGVSKIESELHEAKLTMERYLVEYDQLFRDAQRATEALERQVTVNKHMREEGAEKQRAILHRQEEVRLAQKEMAKVDRLKQMALKMLVDIEADRQQYERKRDELKAEITRLAEVEIKSKRKEVESQRKQMDEYRREREILNKKLSGSERSVHDIRDVILFNHSCMKVLKNEIAGFQATLKTQRDKMNNLLHDKERHEGEAEEANRRYFTSLEQLKLQDIQIRELHKQITGCSSRLKQQQNLYEAVRSDRNLYAKSLLEVQQEIDSMRSKFKIMNHQIEQLKEEIIAKDHALVKEHFLHHLVDKEKEGLRNELTKIKKQIYSSEQMILNQRAEIQKLSQIIQEAEDERARQQKEYESVLCERDILGGQLIKRNDELSALYEKVRLQRSGLRHGEYRYQKCLEEISETGNKFQQLTADRDTYLAKIQSMNDLKQAVIKLESELLHERSKIKALSDEQGTTLNVHRWRNLESSDPQRYEMIRKIQSLQKRIISRNQEIVEKELLIQEKEKIYVELKNILARQPGPEVAEQLDVYQDNLKQKTTQLRAMNDELDMYKQQVSEFRFEIEQTAKEMERLKKQWVNRQLESRSQSTVIAGSKSPYSYYKDIYGGSLGSLTDNQQLLLVNNQHSPVNDPGRGFQAEQVPLPITVPSHTGGSTDYVTEGSYQVGSATEHVDVQ